ncbi:hypothetical protein [Nonomuraea dietziae]|uniref:hypothetical protein n=1 Tax=Nonomuraea dietziae TaxID=65515 RepID=UPI0031D2FF0A
MKIMKDTHGITVAFVPVFLNFPPKRRGLRADQLRLLQLGQPQPAAAERHRRTSPRRTS